RIHSHRKQSCRQTPVEAVPSPQRRPKSRLCRRATHRLRVSRLQLLQPAWLTSPTHDSDKHPPSCALLRADKPSQSLRPKAMGCRLQLEQLWVIIYVAHVHKCVKMVATMSDPAQIIGAIVLTIIGVVFHFLQEDNPLAMFHLSSTWLHLGKINEEIATRFSISARRVLQIEIGTLLAAGF